VLRRRQEHATRCRYVLSPSLSVAKRTTVKDFASSSEIKWWRDIDVKDNEDDDTIKKEIPEGTILSGRGREEAKKSRSVCNCIAATQSASRSSDNPPSQSNRGKPPPMSIALRHTTSCPTYFPHAPHPSAILLHPGAIPKTPLSRWTS
jgi:hypothetical protein